VLTRCLALLALVLAALGGCVREDRAVKADYTGACVDFDYLGDDDDDDSSGGALAPTFDAYAVHDVGTVASGGSIALTVDVVASSVPQANGYLKLTVASDTNDIMPLAPTDVDLDGWTSTGWTNDGGVAPQTWTAEFTLASVAAVSYTLSFTLVTHAPGTIISSTFRSAPYQPHTDSASGAGTLASTEVT
jgi:hypothetical protein